jgi:lipopolysaccharide export system permease protein
MRWPRTLSLYVSREIVAYTLLGLAAISVVMVTRSLVRVLDDLVGAGFRIEDLATVLGLFTAILALYALPVSFLFGVLLAMGRMAADVEITAMRACGVGLRGILLPVGLLGLLLSAATLQLSLEAEPAARRGMAAAVRAMVVRGASVEPGRFNTIGERTVYIDARDARKIRGIMISDRSDPERPFLVFAEAGEMELDEERAEFRLRLERGDLHIEGDRDDERYQRVTFERFEYRFDIDALLGGERTRRPREMTFGELRETVARIDGGDAPELLREAPPAYAVHLQRRWAMPLAPALFALVGVPLGIQRKRGARSWGVILCALLAFTYYALHSFCELLAIESGFPAATVWVPNAVYAAVGAVLLVRAQRAS